MEHMGYEFTLYLVSFVALVFLAKGSNRGTRCRRSLLRRRRVCTSIAVLCGRGAGNRITDSNLGDVAIVGIGGDGL